VGSLGKTKYLTPEKRVPDKPLPILGIIVYAGGDGRIFLMPIICLAVESLHNLSGLVAKGRKLL